MLRAVAPVGATTSVAGLLPALVGRNCTLIMQVPSGAKDAGQLLVCRYCEGLLPPKEMLDTVNGNATLVLELVMVTERAALVCPTFVRVKLRLLAEMVNVGAAVAPFRATAVDSRPAPGVNSREADFVPALVGLNRTLMVQKLPFGTTVPQLFVCV